MSAVRGAASWLLFCACAACGDDGPSTTRPIDSLDGGTMDASPLVDARTQADATSADGSGLPEGPLCSTGAMGIATVSDTSLSPLEPLALSLRSDGASLGWLGFDNAQRRAFVSWFGLGEATFDVPAESDPVEETELAVVATGAGFLSVSSYVPVSVEPAAADADAGASAADAGTFDAGSGVDAGPRDAGNDAPKSAQLRARQTNSVGELIGSTPTALTMDTADHHAPVLALGADGNVLMVWTAHQPTVHGKSAVLSPDGKMLGSSHDLAGFGTVVGRAALSAMGKGYLLAWADAEKRRVHVQVLDAFGVAVGASTQVDADGYARGNLDLSFTDQGGALVFDMLVDGARPEVRVRTFNLSGVAVGNEQQLTPYPDTGARPSLVAVRGGYMVAYRSAQPTTRQLRLALLDAQGALLRGANVTPLNSFDLPLVLRTSPDGEAVFLSWLDQLAGSHGHQLQRTWIHCD